MPLSLLLHADTLAVCDALKIDVMRWTGLGDTLTSQLTLEASARVGTPYAMRGSSILSSSDRREGDARFGALGWSADTAPLIAFPIPPTTFIHLSCRPRPLERPPILSPRFYVANEGSRTVASGTAAYEFWVINEGRVTMSGRGSVKPRPVRRSEIALAAGRGYRMSYNGNQCSLTPQELIAKVGVAPVMPAIHGLSVTADGSVWVLRTFGRQRGLVDQFDSTGAYVRTWRNASLPVGRLPDGRLVVPREDEDSGGYLLELVRLPD